MTYHYDRERASMQRSNNRSLAGNFTTSGTSPMLAAVVNASSTAPVQWFDMPARIGKDRYWDGGLSGYNNPCLAAVVEAIANGVPREQIAVLSIGTGKTLLPIAENGESSPLYKLRTEPGTTNDIKKAATSILQDPPDARSFIAHLMMGGTLPASAANCPYAPPRFVRLNPLIQPLKNNNGQIPPKGLSESEFAQLVKMDLAVTDTEDIPLIDKFAEAWLAGDVVNQSLRVNRDLMCEIGSPTFSAAKDVWIALR